MIQIPRLRFAHLPTPVEPMPRLSAALGGPAIWIKRDDQTGLALGGNKARKLEFLIGDARREGATTVVTTGAVQSNHARMTAAAEAYRTGDATGGQRWADAMRRYATLLRQHIDKENHILF